MTNSDMIIESIGECPCVFGIALNSIIGRKISYGVNNKKDENIIDKLYLPNGLVQTAPNIPTCSKLTLKSINSHPIDVVSDDLYYRLLELSDIRKSKVSVLPKSLNNIQQPESKPRAASTERNKKNKGKNDTRNKNKK